MIRLAALAASIALFLGGSEVSAAQAGQSDAQAPAADPGTIILPAGTRIELAVTMPVWAASASPGDPVYAQTYFPVIAGNSVAIPAGTFVQGETEAVKRPTRRVSRAGIDILFKKIVFANGYVIELPPAQVVATPATQPTAARLTIEASSANDLLLDNGAQFEISLAAPLVLNAGQIAAAIRVGRPPDPGKFRSATLCRPTPGSPGSPGTPDTVIPGSPGTPSTTIPGGPGMPDITIPGTPATPPTVIPGSPGTPDTPGTTCPGAPIVVRSEPIDLSRQPGPNADSTKTRP